MSFLKIAVISFLGLWFQKPHKTVTVIPTDYKISFKIKNANHTVDGSFSALRVDYKFDAQALNSSFFYGTIEVNTIKTGIAMRDRHLKKKEYFDALNYPQISLKSKKIARVSPDKYILDCDLTIKGITKAISIPAAIKNDKAGLNLKSEFEINRQDFGLGSPSIVMSKHVMVIIEVIIPE